MKGVIFWLCVLGSVFAAGFGCGRCAMKEPEPVEPVVVRDTVEVVKCDTIRETETRFVREVVADTVWVDIKPNLNPNINEDSAAVVRVSREFSGELYRAWVSGVDPWLDSIDVKREIVERVVTIESKPPAAPMKRWGLGASAGLTYDFANRRPAPFIGIGISYNIIVW